MLDLNETTISIVYDNMTGRQNNSLASYHEEDILMNNEAFKIGLISCYVLIFIITFVGNLLVILVVMLQKKMRTSTNYFFTNLAFSDLCVALFCIFQDLTSILRPVWPFGQLMCKMYHFTQTMSYTASIFTMVIISIERYIAICYPIKAKKVLQMRNFQLCILLVWILSATLCAPNLWMFGVMEQSRFGGSGEVCVQQKLLYNTRFFNIINVVLLFLFPMFLMTLLYIRLGLKLHLRNFDRMDSKKKKKEVQEFYAFSENSIGSDTITQTVGIDGDWSSPKCLLKRKDYSLTDFRDDFSRIYGQGYNGTRGSRKSKKTSVMYARRRVVRLLVVVVLTFAICHAPIHLRKLIQDWCLGYEEASIEARLATIITNLLIYINSGVNPILYALLSSKFRKSMKTLMSC